MDFPRLLEDSTDRRRHRDMCIRTSPMDTTVPRHIYRRQT